MIELAFRTRVSPTSSARLATRNAGGVETPALHIALFRKDRKRGAGSASKPPTS